MSGDLVVGQFCPKCEQEALVYNGNYSCTECGWVMPERGNGRETARERQIIRAYLLQRLHEAEAKGDQAEIDRITYFLLDYLPIEIREEET